MTTAEALVLAIAPQIRAKIQSLTIGQNYHFTILRPLGLLIDGDLIIRDNDIQVKVCIYSHTISKDPTAGITIQRIS